MGGITSSGSAFTPNPGPISLAGVTAGEVLTMGAGGKPTFAAAGGGIPNATLYWCTVGPVNPAPFVIWKGDGKITGGMFTFRTSGQYVLDLSSLLSTGIYALFGGGVYDGVAGSGFPSSLSFYNSTFSGAWPDHGATKTVGIANNHWNGAGFVATDDDFSLLILAQ